MTWRLALTLMIASHAWACSCSGNWPSVKQEWEKALGKVLHTDPPIHRAGQTFPIDTPA